MGNTKKGQVNKSECLASGHENLLCHKAVY